MRSSVSTGSTDLRETGWVVSSFISKLAVSDDVYGELKHCSVKIYFILCEVNNVAWMDIDRTVQLH